MMGPEARERTMDLRLIGFILAVTGLVAVVVSATRGPNLGIPRQTGINIGIALLVIGAALVIYAIAFPG